MLRIVIGSRFRASYALYVEPDDRYRVLVDNAWEPRRAAALAPGDILEARGRIEKCEVLDAQGTA